MKIKYIALLVFITLTCSSCKLLKTHVVKLTSSAEIQNDAILLKTTKGYVYLTTKKMTEPQKQILSNLLPFQCLEIKTPEQFDMQNRKVYFDDFQIKSLPTSHPDCRKVKVTTRISIN